MRRSLVLILAALMLCGATITGQTQIQGPYLLTDQAVAGSFVTLAASSLYGTSGSLIDMTDRVRVPRLLDKPDTSSWTEDSSFRSGGCSSDATTWAAIKAAAESSDNQIIYLPDDCLVRIPVTPTTGSTAQYTLANSTDRIDFRCHSSTTFGACGLQPFPDVPGGNPEWRYGSGDVSRAGIGKYPLAIGSDRTSGVNASCTWTGGYGLNNRRIQLTGCDLSGWSAGDIIRISAVGEPNTTAERWDWLTRITCVDNTNDSVANGTGTECDQLDADNKQIQIRSGLPRDYADSAYFWGSTTGRTVTLIETSATNHMAEDIWFTNMVVDFERDELFNGSGIRWINVMDGGVYGVRFDGCTSSCMSFGGSSSTGSSNSAQAGGIRIMHSDFTDMVADSNCFAEIVELFAENPGRVRFYNAGCAMTFAGDPLVEFDQDVSEASLRNTTHVRGVASDNGDGTSTVTLTGFDMTGIGSTAGGGLLINYDQYNAGLTYCNSYASDIQFVNVSMVNTRQGPLYQTGCAGHTVFASYISNDPTAVPGLRGVFPHGNGAAPGAHVEMLDFDLALVPYANSNPAEGEGTNVTWFKNRGRNAGTPTWPPGTSGSVWQCSSGTICISEQPDQNGTTNEEWNVFENVIQGFDAANDQFDDGAIGGDKGTPVAPHTLYRLAFFRNRAVASGYNLDANLELSSDNATTLTDLTGSNTNGTLYEDDDVPAAYAAEVAGVPTAIAVSAVPDWWCQESGTFGEMGAHYDDFNGGTLLPLPAQIRAEAGTCTPP